MVDDEVAVIEAWLEYELGNNEMCTVELAELATWVEAKGLTYVVGLDCLVVALFVIGMELVRFVTSAAEGGFILFSFFLAFQSFFIQPIQLTTN